MKSLVSVISPAPIPFKLKPSMANFILLDGRYKELSIKRKTDREQARVRRGSCAGHARVGRVHALFIVFTHSAGAGQAHCSGGGGVERELRTRFVCYLSYKFNGICPCPTRWPHALSVEVSDGCGSRASPDLHPPRAHAVCFALKIIYYYNNVLSLKNIEY